MTSHPLRNVFEAMMEKGHVKLVRKRIKQMFSGSLEKQSLKLFPVYYDNFSNFDIKFSHFKVLSKPRTLKCENLTILI